MEIYRRAINPDIIEKALRRIYLEFHSNFRSDQIKDYQAGTWFPWLRQSNEILQTQPPRWEAISPSEFGRWCEPQIVFQFPDWAEVWPLELHVDKPPPWAEGKPYAFIAGVALTPQLPGNGSVRVLSDGEIRAVTMNPGDVLYMKPDEQHAPYLNRSSTPRSMIYWRALASTLP